MNEALPPRTFQCGGREYRLKAIEDVDLVEIYDIRVVLTKFQAIGELLQEEGQREEVIRLQGSMRSAAEKVLIDPQEVAHLASTTRVAQMLSAFLGAAPKPAQTEATEVFMSPSPDSPGSTEAGRENGLNALTV
jgi:hypothetical protein